MSSRAVGAGQVDSYRIHTRAAVELAEPLDWVRLAPIFERSPQGRDAAKAVGMGMDDYLAANKALWEEWTAIHETSSFYNLEGFKAGGSRLRTYEVDEVGEVTGKSLLHLQCHFGIDTLLWARLGARVTGADFSDRAIQLARSLAAELGLAATFVCSDLYDLPAVLDEQFDVVYTSHGVFGWLPDLERWAGVVAHFLGPGGVFYLTEIHPVARAFAEEPGLRLGYPYFPRPEPLASPVQGSYADPTAQVRQPVEYWWAHSMG